MTNIETSYVLAKSYEHFMVNALGNKFEYCQSDMINLIDVENGINSFGLPTREKQTQAIKKNMEKAFVVFLKMKLEKNAVDEIQICYDDFQIANDSKTLLLIINKVLKLISPPVRH